MNRKAFLSSIAALISIPFLGKSKEKEITLEQWIKANPELYRLIVEKAIDSAIAKMAGNQLLTLGGQMKVTGKDIIMVYERKNANKDH